MKECFSLFTEQSKMFDLPVGERVPTIKDYIQSYKERLWDTLTIKEKIEICKE